MDTIDINQAVKKAKRALEKSGQVGRIEPYTASFVLPAKEDITADVTLMDLDFKWFSSITPTKEEMLACKATASWDGQVETFQGDIEITIEATGAYCAQISGMLFVVSTVTENELGTLPKTGIYYCTTTFINNEIYNEGLKVTLDFAETIHPIDPKFIPGAVLPVLELSTETMTALLGSGNASATEEETTIVTAAYENVMPLVIKGDLSGTRMSCVANLAGDEVASFAGVTALGTITATIENDAVTFKFTAG